MILRKGSNMIPTDTQKIDYSWILLGRLSDPKDGCLATRPIFILSACNVRHEAAPTFKSTRNRLSLEFHSSQRIRRIYPSFLLPRLVIPYLREKIDAHLLQRRHRPRRHPRHVASVRLTEVSAQEVRVPILDDGRSDFPHQRQQIVHVMHRQSTMQINK